LPGRSFLLMKIISLFAADFYCNLEQIIISIEFFLPFVFKVRFSKLSLLFIRGTVLATLSQIKIMSLRPRWSSPAEPLFGLVTNNRSQATAKPFPKFCIFIYAFNKF